MGKVEVFKCDYERCQNTAGSPWLIIKEMESHHYINNGHQVITLKDKHFCNFYCLENQIALMEAREEFTKIVKKEQR